MAAVIWFNRVTNQFIFHLYFKLEVTMPDQNEFMERKLRRRIEEYLRTTTSEMLIKVADICRIKVPEKLRKKYAKPDDACK